ncbi:MAG: MoaD/ThiS family protein [Sphingomonadales bacterium]|nr:MAG: MoaD/ThiS family protein [Sphingomonadales bacterium]
METLNILYFAWVREAIGKDGEQIEHPGAEMRIIDLIAMLKEKGAGYAEAFANPEKLRAAIDHAFVPLDCVLGHASELALFPPVTGG